MALAQQGVEAVGHIVTAKLSTGNHQGEPSVGNRSDDRAKHARSEEASSASENWHLGNNDAHRRITQNRW
jgi:hypothetical protein